MSLTSVMSLLASRFPCVISFVFPFSHSATLLAKSETTSFALPGPVVLKSLAATVFTLLFLWYCYVSMSCATLLTPYG